MYFSNQPAACLACFLVVARPLLYTIPPMETVHRKGTCTLPRIRAEQWLLFAREINRFLQHIQILWHIHIILCDPQWNNFMMQNDWIYFIHIEARVLIPFLTFSYKANRKLPSSAFVKYGLQNIKHSDKIGKQHLYIHRTASLTHFISSNDCLLWVSWNMVLGELHARYPGISQMRLWQEHFCGVYSVLTSH